MLRANTSTTAAGQIRKAILLLLILLGLFLAALAFLDRTQQIEFALVLNSPWFELAIILELAALALFVGAWFVLLGSEQSARFSITEASAHIGITLVGKYLPGKVWGLLGRAYLMTQRGMPARTAAHYLLADQFVTFYSGVCIGTLALLGVYNSSLALLLLIVIVGFTPWMIRVYPAVLNHLRKLFGRFLNRFDAAEMSTDILVNPSRLLGSLVLYVIHWLLTSLVLVLLFINQVDSELMVNALLIAAAIPLGVLTGFLALWAPGGIGIREGIIVAILAINIQWETATAIAIVYRLICVINDLLMGVCAMSYYGRHAPKNEK